MKPFVRSLIDFFEAPERAHAELATPTATTSSPQRDQPPAVVLAAMRWMPRPSLRTAIAMIGLAIGALVLADRRSRSRAVCAS
jgi:protease I